jgi:hypothetical protein
LHGASGITGGDEKAAQPVEMLGGRIVVDHGLDHRCGAVVLPTQLQPVG